MGKLEKTGIDVAKSPVEKYMVCRRKPPSPTWRAFLKNHLKEIVAVDFFIVPTVRNQFLFVFLVLAHAGHAMCNASQLKPIDMPDRPGIVTGQRTHHVWSLPGFQAC